MLQSNYDHQSKQWVYRLLFRVVLYSVSRCRHVAVYAFGSFVTWNVLDPVRLPEFKVLIDVS